MNEITCDICKDLIPLVKDGIASEDSAKAVARHIKTCDECRAVYGGELPPVIDTTKAFQKFKRKIHLFFAMLMMFGIFFGLSLIAGLMHFAFKKEGK